jgi:hypothetical protein
MKGRILALCALALAGIAHGGPLVIEQSATIVPPDASWRYFGRFGVAIDGDFALISGDRFVADAAQPNGQRHEGAALIYQRSGTTWNFVGPLGPVTTLSPSVRPGLAMKDGIAMVILDAARVFERTGSSWTQSPLEASLQAGLQGTDIKIDNGRILAPRLACENDAVVLRKVNGTWSSEGVLDGQANICGDTPPLPFIDIQGELAAVFDAYGPDLQRPAARLFRVSNSTWSPYVAFEGSSDSYVFGPAISLARPFLAVTGSRQRGTTIFWETPSGSSWGGAATGLQPADAYLQPGSQSTLSIERVIRPDGTPLFVQRNYNDARKGYVINAFRVNNDPYAASTHVATLQARLDYSIGDQLDVSGQRVIVNGRTGLTGHNHVYVFELPASLEQPALQAHDFESPSSGAAWTWLAGSTFTVGNEPNNHFYRQTSTAGDAGAWLTNSVGRNQAIQAEIMVRSFASGGTDRWVGLMTRRRDDGNYYYVALLQSGSVQLRKVVNGVISTLDTEPMTVTPARKYRLRLESMGRTHRVYVDERLVLTAYDASHTLGTAGLRMYRASADFDNVIVSPSPQATIFAQDFNVDGVQVDWSYVGSTYTATQGVYRQSYTGGDAKAIAGAMTGDSIVRARVKPTSLLNGNSWIGLLARGKDPGDYVYVSLRSNNTVTLRRLVSGNVYPIAEVPYTVTAGNWYSLRLEIVAGLTRVIINDKVVIASNADHGPTQRYTAIEYGAVGLVSYRAAGDYDDFLAYQP